MAKPTLSIPPDPSDDPDRPEFWERQKALNSPVELTRPLPRQQPPPRSTSPTTATTSRSQTPNDQAAAALLRRRADPFDADLIPHATSTPHHSRRPVPQFTDDEDDVPIAPAPAKALRVDVETVPLRMRKGITHSPGQVALVQPRAPEQPRLQEEQEIVDVVGDEFDGEDGFLCL